MAGAVEGDDAVAIAQSVSQGLDRLAQIAARAVKQDEHRRISPRRHVDVMQADGVQLKELADRWPAPLDLQNNHP